VASSRGHVVRGDGAWRAAPSWGGHRGLLFDASGWRDETKVMAATLPAASHSSTIALNREDRQLWVVNREANSVSVIQARDRVGSNFQDLTNNLAEIPVGLEPRCVVTHPNNLATFVTNALSGTVSVINQRFGVVTHVKVGTEPRGCALSPSGNFLYVANHTEGTVSIIDTRRNAAHPLPTVIGTVFIGGNPSALAVTNDGDAQDADEVVFVTQFFAELIPGGPGEGRDLGKQGWSTRFRRGWPILRQSPRSSCLRSPIPALPPTAVPSA
jgi:YVTN family beta-propeller protein